VDTACVFESTGDSMAAPKAEVSSTVLFFAGCDLFCSALESVGVLRENTYFVGVGKSHHSSLKTC
jgi:hypothetical protein